MGNRKSILHHYTTEDGLFHNEIRLIRKANNGMLWLGTQNGLSSFDGYRFTVYKHDKTNPNSLCSDKIYALETSTTGKVWVGTTVGLCALNPSIGNSVAFPDTFKIKNRLASAFITSLFEDRSGYLWIAASSGNFRYSVHHQTMEQVLSGKNVVNYYESREGIFWICHDQVLSKYSRETDKIIKTYPHPIYKLYTDRFGVLWGVGAKGLYRYMPDKTDFELLPKVKPALKGGFSSIAEDRDGRLLLGVYGGGVTLYDPKDNSISHLIAHPNQKDALSSNDVYDIYSDNAGVVWIGTQEGLDVYDWSRQRFLKWKHDPENRNGLSNGFIQAIYRDQDNQLWLGTRDNGLERLKGNKIEENPEFEHISHKQKDDGVNGEYIAGMLEDSKGRFWVASWGGGLNLKQPESEEWINFQHSINDPQSIAGNQVISVLEDRRGRIWIGTLNGLSRLQENVKGGYHFQNYRHQKDDSLSLSNKAVFKLFEDSQGRIWLGTTNGGLNLMHEKPNGEIQFERFMHQSNNPRSISNNEVFVVFEDSKRRLWVGTSLNGFNRVYEETGIGGDSKFWFKSYQEKDGLSDNEVNAILEDDFGNLWISTNKGLSKFNPDDESFVNYTEYDGVLKGKFRKNAAWKDHDGTMFFGGAAGVNIFNSTHFPKNQIPPTPQITGVFIDGQQYFENDSLDGQLLLTRDDSGILKLILPKKTNRFEVQFSAMSFTSPKRNKYQWRLNDYQTEWHNYEGGNPKAIYTALPSGNYRLSIKAANNDGVWTNLPAKMVVVVSSGTQVIMASVIGAVILMLSTFGLLVFFRRKRDANQRKHSRIAISNEDQQLIDRLNSLMSANKPYLNCKLGLTDLAEELCVSPNQLSALLNEQIGQPFYDYVNEFRIEEVKRRLMDPSEKKKTILAIAWECGFNSKSAFNRVFKINTGITPSEFQKRHT
ncbi:ligand-binding sensor domain-containing protein [Sunxiuqinia sp. sy24]|uniref:ligand-binding sensor domain-containing protein n=1 Tax=Sunxiuqinia sp. sy24 TaxID=3461495 RepID=UPI0040454CCC